MKKAVNFKLAALDILEQNIPIQWPFKLQVSKFIKIVKESLPFIKVYCPTLRRK
jgi:hypothetical protein